MIQFTLPIAPVAWERVKRGRYGQAYVPAKTRQFEIKAGWLARQAFSGPPLGVPLKLTARFILTPPRRPTFKVPAVRPDLSNYLKSLEDALNGIVWRDDALLTEIVATKLYDLTGAGARIEVTVEEIEGGTK